jgi:hypothetical protein
VAAAGQEDGAQVPLILELAEPLIAGLPVGESSTETKRQGEQETSTIVSDNAQASSMKEDHGLRMRWRVANAKSQINSRAAFPQAEAKAFEQC